MEKLKCETNTPEIESAIRLAFAKLHPEFEEVDVFFEHGCWWVRGANKQYEFTYSVNDAEDEIGNPDGPWYANGFCFEVL